MEQSIRRIAATIGGAAPTMRAKSTFCGILPKLIMALKGSGSGSNTITIRFAGSFRLRI
jgi:hypothetical protein